MPVNVGSVPEPEKTELKRAAKESMHMTIVGESDDDRLLITLTGLSTKKPDDGKGDHVRRETTAFTDTPRVNPVSEIMAATAL